jgi:hypothetical protein
MQMGDKRTPKRILQWKPIDTRTRGRPRKRWIAGIEVRYVNNGSKTVEKTV